MHTYRYLLFALFTVFLLGNQPSSAQQKPNIHILATGGTIAGAGTSATQSSYTAGQVTISTLLDAVPLQDLADVTGEQVVNIGSQDMTDEVWLTLAKRINELLQQPDIDGIVVTHGTDTMEETAYFLHLTVHSDKPVVLVGAMRSSTAISADGPANIYNAVATAAAKESKGKGVIVAIDNTLIGARSVYKSNTLHVGTFQPANQDALGYLYNGKPYYTATSTKKHTTASVFDVSSLDKLPKVGIIYSYSNIEEDMVRPMLDNGYQGIIHAGVGNGNIHQNVFPVLEEARRQGVQVVRSTRIPTGPTTLDAEIDDAHYQFIASGDLNPQKARVLLMLALTKTDNWQVIQDYFNEY